MIELLDTQRILDSGDMAFDCLNSTGANLEGQ